jgi:methyl-accepting chemotaxis protein
MFALGNLKVGVRLFTGFAVVLIVLCATCAMALYQASRIEAGTQDLAQNWFPGVQVLGDLRSATDSERRATLRAVLEVDPQYKQDAIAERNHALSKISRAFAAYDKLIDSPAERELLEHDRAGWAKYQKIDDKLVELAMAGDSDFAAVRTLAAESSHDYREYAHKVDAHVAFNRKGATQASARASAYYRSALQLAIAAIVLAIILSIAVAYVITRSITVPIDQAVTIAVTVARGDLTSHIEVRGKDELSQLLGALRHMNERLVDIVTQVRGSSESVATGAAQIATGNADLSQRTEEQAASLEETAASMQQLTATVKQNAENARQGNTLANSAADIAQRGGDVMRDVVTTMEGIASSSERVEQIIGVIDGIAFQTNILALNAAVEAARAGEQGRGFAVVASEVRSLAQRSASAAREIKELIGQSVARVDAGSLQVHEAGGTIGEIVRTVRHVTDLMREIAAASDDQHTGIVQINQAIGQIDEVTQHNAALVEQASAAAQNVQEQSALLQRLVANFRLDASDGAPFSGGDTRRANERSASSRNPAAKRPVSGPATAQFTWNVNT